jgi:hypothetical protein
VGRRKTKFAKDSFVHFSSSAFHAFEEKRKMKSGISNCEAIHELEIQVNGAFHHLFMDGSKKFHHYSPFIFLAIFVPLCTIMN